MEFAGLIEALWRRRWLLGLGIVAAVAIAVLASFRVSLSPPKLEARKTETAVAQARVFVDTAHPLLDAAEPQGNDTIAARAALLSALMARAGLRSEVARRADLDPAELGVVPTYLGVPASATPLSRKADEVTLPTEPQLLTVGIEDPRLPIVSFFAQAPSAETAVRLVNAATDAFESLADAGPSGTGGVKMKRLGAVELQRVQSGTGVPKAGAAAVVFFALWCVGVFLFDMILRWRSAAPRAGDGLARGNQAAADL